MLERARMRSRKLRLHSHIHSKIIFSFVEMNDAIVNAWYLMWAAHKKSHNMHDSIIDENAPKEYIYHIFMNLASSLL